MLLGKIWKTCATPEAVKMVLEALKTARSDVPGLTTKQIYEAVHQRYPDVERTSFPARMVNATPPKFKTRAFSYTTEPRPPPLPEILTRDHPVRSIRYLKKFVLEEMAEKNLIEKIHLSKSELPPDVREEIRPKVAPRNKKMKALLSRSDAWLWKLNPLAEDIDPVAAFKPVPEPTRAPPRERPQSRERPQWQMRDERGEREFPPHPKYSDVD
ncbi:hypothetical protein OBBRIDRAFT_830513 [Obba rivulosa]|uniref:Uncharacterized protein n=1 Tax=Obba rivulosa TaxID=1052685 RepID=A0A8E2DTZ0_9APHY|nr:hypothetical protein OBBRIDRAFT_830513 [Obba rivulosa]